ncbi:MAG TPA: hypothetical protein VE110_10715 [Gemmatimonadaceae bacterium]|nr:hypothetical protein [Gemmatimonadaceae bacterium]
MDQKPQNPQNKNNRAADQTDDDVQDELSREGAEGKDLTGDVKQNRNLSGSSTWETLPEPPDSKP